MSWFYVDTFLGSFVDTNTYLCNVIYFFKKVNAKSQDTFFKILIISIVCWIRPWRMLWRTCYDYLYRLKICMSWKLKILTRIMSKTLRFFFPSCFHKVWGSVTNILLPWQPVCYLCNVFREYSYLHCDYFSLPQMCGCRLAARFLKNRHP